MIPVCQILVCKYSDKRDKKASNLVPSKNQAAGGGLAKLLGSPLNESRLVEMKPVRFDSRRPLTHSIALSVMEYQQPLDATDPAADAVKMKSVRMLSAVGVR